MPFINQDLPYEADHLEPIISARTVEFHYGKHQAGYASNLEVLTNGTAFSDMDLISVIKETVFDNDEAAIYNNAAQLWNHIFYWDGLKHAEKENVGGTLKGDFAEAVKAAFGSEENMKAKLIEAAVSIFGSGWAWLVLDPKTKLLSIVKTQNAGNPVTMDMVPLFTIDVWEHAYYLDYQNRRAEYAKALVEELADWGVVQERYGAAMSK